MLAGVALGVCGVLAGVLSSSVKLNESHLHTGLGGVYGMFCGVTGSGLNKACSMLETWWILDVFLSRVGKLMGLNCFHNLHLLAIVASQRQNLG